MSDDRRFEQEARSWLELGPTQAPDRAVQAVLLAIETTPQQRGAHAPWRIRPMFGPLRAAALAALLFAFALGAGPLGLLSGLNAPAAPTLPPTACPSDVPLASGYIGTIAGPGDAGSGSSGDDGPATAATFNLMFATLAVHPDGAVFVSDPFGHAIRRIGVDGVVTTFAGPSTGSPMEFPRGLAFDTAGDLYVADPSSDLSKNHVWKIDAAGETTIVPGDVGPELDAWTVAAGPGGEVYIDHGAGYTVRTLDELGVHPFAGAPGKSFSGDGGPATEAGVDVGGFGVDGAGNVYILDLSGRRVRKVDSSGIITTVAGTGKAGFSGDGGPAIEAEIDPALIAVDSDGSLYISDQSRGVVRRIDPAGIITTIAGTGKGGYSGDCGPAVEAQLSRPSTLAVRDGVVYVTDEGNERIRMIVP